MSSLLAGYKFHVLARYGLANQVPAAKLAEMLWDVDTKTFRVGDDTPNPPRIMSEKSTGVFNFNDIDYAQFANLLLKEGGTIDGIKPAELNKNQGFVYRNEPGEFNNVTVTSDTSSISVGPVMPNPLLPDTYSMSIDLSPELMALLSDGFDLRNIPFVEVLPSTLEYPLYRYQDTIYVWNNIDQIYEPIGIPVIREYNRLPSAPGPFVYIDATSIEDFRLMMWTGTTYTYIGSEANVVIGDEPEEPAQGSYWYYNNTLKIYVDNEWLTIAFDSATSEINLAKRGLLLQWRYDDEGYAWEFWVPNRDFNMRQLPSSQGVTTMQNDDTVTVENAYAFTPGNQYVIFDDTGARAIIEVFSVISPTTIRAVETLNISVSASAGARIGSTSFEINNDGTATVFGNQEYFSRPIRTLHSWPGGSLIIQRNSIDSSGLYEVRYKEAGTDIWKEAELVRTYGVEFTQFTEEEYRIPIGNTSIEFWISYKGTPGHREVVNSFALITQYQNFDSDRIEKPTNISPADQATNISVTPTLSGSTYRSLYGLPQIGAHFQISRDVSFYDMVLNTSSDTLVSWVNVAGQTGTFYAIEMLSDREAIMVGASNKAIYTEDGGLTWEAVTPGVGSGDLRDVAWNHSDTIIAVGNTGRVVYTTDYGANWVAAASVDGFAGNIMGVAAHESYAVAVGASGKILSSINKGSIWSSVMTAGGYTGTFYDVAMTTAGRCIAVGANGAIHTSADYGVNWSVRTPAAAFNGTFYSVTLTEGGYAIAVGANGTIQTSSDFGSTWTTRSAASGYGGSFMAVTMLDSKAVAVGASGEIQTSYNRGQTWVKRPAGSGISTQFNAVGMNAEPYGILAGDSDVIQHTYVLEGAGTTFTVPAGADLLEVNNLYWWRCRYQDSVGKWSSWSDPTAFATQPDFSFIGQPSNIAPASDATSVANTPILQSSNFSYGGSIADTHDSSQWQIATSADFLSPVYDSGAISDLIQHQVPGGASLSNFTTYWWRVRHIGTTIGAGPWSIPTKFTVRATPSAPTITSPVTGSTGISLTPTITTSSYVSQDPTSSHAASQYQFSKNAGFSNIDFDSNETSNLTSYTVPGGNLEAFTKYYVRARHRGLNSGWSNWSASIEFTTIVVNILTPTVTTSNVTGTTVVLRTTAFGITSGANDSHESTDWEIRTTNDGAGTLIWSSTDNTTNKVQITGVGLPPGSTLFARARHKGTLYGHSNWSASISFTTPTVTGQQVYTVPGTYTFTVPDGVFSICAVCVGGGGNGYSGAGFSPGAWGSNGTGGAGAGLRWRNNIPVTPGSQIPIVVGGPGQASTIQNMLRGDGGSHGVLSGTAQGGGGNLFGGSGGGGNGGPARLADDRRTGAGGGAAGYTGNGGTGHYSNRNGSGGGGGGGSHGLHSPSSSLSGGGGGVGLIKQGANGGNNNRRGLGGSGGTNSSAPGAGSGRPNGGVCGGGGGSRNGATFGLGGNGGVRIIWGPGRSYPNQSD